MRIWAFPWIYPYDRPGLEWLGIFAHRQYKGLIKNGADLKVVIPVPWSPPFPFAHLHYDWKYYARIGYPYKREHDGVTIYHPKIYNMRPNRFVKKSFDERTVDAIVGFFKQNNIVLDPAKDVFYSQWTPNSAVIQKAANLLGVKSCILVIGDDVLVYPHQKPQNFDIFKKTWAEADNRFVVADYLGKEANKITGLDMPYTVIFMGVEYNYFKPGIADEILLTKNEYKIPIDKTIILSIGTAIYRKGWIDLLDALKEAKKINDNFVLVAIHAGSPEFDLDEEAGKRGLSANFLNLGEIKSSLLNRLYNTADIFCLPSHWEGMANVVIEAMSSGLPVITTDVCGHPEIVKQGVTGILVPPKQPEILANELLLLLNDKEKRTRLGTNARDFIVNRWGDFEHNTALLYKKLQEAGFKK